MVPEYGILDTGGVPMKRFAEKIWGRRGFFDLWLFAGKYAAMLQLIAALIFRGYSYGNGPIGFLTFADAMLESALVTLTLTADFALCGRLLRNKGLKF